MVMVELAGGLGNQMFEYAAGRAVALRNRQPLRLDTQTAMSQDQLFQRSYELRVFNVRGRVAADGDRARLFARPAPYRARWFVDLVRRTIPGAACHLPVWGIEPFGYDPAVETRYGSHVWLRGYFQNDGYVRAIRQKLLREFTLREPLNGAAAQLAGEMRSCESLAVHVRQKFGDGVGRYDESTDEKHGVLGTDYYAQAWETMKPQGIERVFVFGDDLEWGRNTLKFPVPVTYVEGNRNYEDLVLISACKHQIIANSSFAWWGAWLNTNPGKVVVAPRSFMAEAGDTSSMYPREWVVIG